MSTSTRSPWQLCLMFFLISICRSAAIPSEYVEAGNATLTTRTFIGPPSINNCAALGDSFSAGPGAGNIIDGNTKCARSSLSYPEYLKNSTLLGLNRNQFSFQSCTGDVTTDVRANQVQALNSGTTFITLSVGGNDITFSSILLKCIFNLPGNCQNAIDNGRSILYGTDFFNNYYGLIQRILTNMGVKTGLADAGTRIIQTGYPGFFNEITDQCDTVSFALIGDNSLTKAFRAQFNQLGGELNAYLAWVLDTFSDDLYGQPLPFVSRGSFIDQGLSYRSHRFCERNVIEPDRQNTNTWVYNLGSNSGDTFTAANVTGINTAACEQQAGQDQAALFNCLLAIAYQQNPGLHLNYAPDTTPLNYVKTFRPTPGGHAATSDEILFQLTTNTATITGQTLRIMCMGDSLTAGFRSSDNNGYRSTVFNYLTGFRPANDVQMVGGVIVGSPPYDHSEGHSGYTIDQLMESIQASNIVAQTKPNVVLLMIGTNDVGKHTYPIADAYGKLTGLINYIFLNSERTAVILAQIPPIGLQPGAPGPPSAQQQLVIQYNAIVARVANSFQDAGRNVYLLHTTTTMNDHFPTDPLHLGDYGYKKLGFDFAKAILTINELGWIRIPEAATGTSTTTAAACSNKPNLIPNGQIANGAGLGANRYPDIICSDSPTGEPQCHCGNSDGSGVDFVVPLTGSSCADMSYYLVNAVHFADINGDGLQDFLWVDADGKVTAFINGGPMDPTKTLDLAQVNWYPAGVIAGGVGGKRHEIQFADLNGDGRAEYLWVHTNGSVDAWINSGFQWQGPVGGGKASVGWLSQGRVAGGIGAPGSWITFADLNGDGRAEYISVNDIGALHAYLNGVIANGVGGLRNNTVFADINGKGRADYLKVTRVGGGAVDWWYNQGGPDTGANAAKVSWWDRGIITGGDGSSGANVMFADLNGDGRAEYIEVDPNTSAITAYYNACPA